MSLEEKINIEIEELQNKIIEKEKVKGLLKKYPDLEEHFDRWNNKYYSTSSVNQQVDQVYFQHSCGCCPDAPLRAFFYKEMDGIKIFANPFSIGIGEKNPSGCGDYPYDYWREGLIQHNIPKTMEKIVEEYFKEHPPENYDEDDEDFNLE